MDIKKLKGIELYDYMTQVYEDENYRSIILMLPDAVGYFYNALRLLEEVVKNDKKFDIIYPMLGDKPTKEMEFVGSVLDGAMYII